MEGSVFNFHATYNFTFFSYFWRPVCTPTVPHFLTLMFDELVCYVNLRGELRETCKCILYYKSNLCFYGCFTKNETQMEKAEARALEVLEIWVVRD